MSYELLYLIPTKFTENEVPQITAKVNELIKKYNGEITKEESLGKRKIAYPIKQNRHGHFVFAQIQMPPESLPRFNQDLNNLSEVLRHSITRYAPGSFEPTKKTRIAPLEGQQTEETKKISQEITKAESDILTAPVDSPAVSESQPKESPSKEKLDKSKVSLEDLDKKLEEILSDDLNA